MKTAREIPTMQIVDRGTWMVFRIPIDLFTERQREQVRLYLNALPLNDRKFSNTLGAWCIKSGWLDPIVELFTTNGVTPIVEG